jgi:hypothetical protein
MSKNQRVETTPNGAVREEDRSGEPPVGHADRFAAADEARRVGSCE